MVGAVIGSYQLVRKLGEGGMGAVYLAQHTLLGRRAALKVLLPALSARPEIVNRFFNEARAATSISDPGIVQVFDFGYHSTRAARSCPWSALCASPRCARPASSQARSIARSLPSCGPRWPRATSRKRSSTATMPSWCHACGDR